MRRAVDLEPRPKTDTSPDRIRGEAKILDPCSSSQIHLWSQSKILRLSAHAEV